MKAERSVAIAGCGSAGPALAVLLARQGWRVRPWFQSEREWLTPARRVFFRAMQRIGPARRFMTRTMAGLAVSGES
ncbi:hypothetical protein [Haloferula sp. A504]|uniref:hypothetical protein n=1 Tax=Haloferula sp. A504 TaxID=3373601 RepID=UPI0031C429C2|nr:hypothetical protein [Verrucomicrobiaceae bacterium E54]